MGSPDTVVFRPEPEESPGLVGFHNSKPDISEARVIEGSSYRDCSTVCIIPTRGRDEKAHHKWADAYRALMVPMNQKFHPLRLAGMEVADAYNAGIQAILDHPDLSTWRFVLTYESDNTPPPDGLLKLIETMYSGPWAAVAGLYWTKGPEGMPMIYGDPKDPEVNFRPQVPTVDGPQECRGVAMGFTLWDMHLFKDKRLRTPWFKTTQSYTPWQGASAGTQDLEFCARIGELGYRMCVDTRVRVGHVQFDGNPQYPEGFVW